MRYFIIGNKKLRLTLLDVTEGVGAWETRECTAEPYACAQTLQ
jgi:hypothetical protein